MRRPRSMPAAAVICLLFPLLGSGRAFAQPISLDAATPILAGASQTLTLEQAVDRALDHNARIRARRLEVDRATALRDQATTGRNPELSFEIENFARRGAAEVDWTLSLSQVLERGSKRAARVREADAEITVRRAAVDEEQVAIAAEVARLYLRSLALDRLRDLAEQMVRTAEEVQVAVARKVEAGAVSPVERNRAAVERAQASIERDTVARDAALSQLRLAALWGGEQADSLVLAGDFDTLPAAVRIDSLAASVSTTPAFRRWSAEIDLRASRVSLEESRTRQDLSLESGARFHGDSDDLTLLAGISMPIPIRDQNRGAVRAAQKDVEVAEFDQEAARIEWSIALREWNSIFEHESRRVGTIRHHVLPAASQAFHDLQAGYLQGRYTYIDLLDARRSWIRAVRDEVEALLASHLARVELESLTAAAGIDRGAPKP